MTSVGRLLCCIGLLATLPVVLLTSNDKNERLNDIKKSIELLNSVGERLPKDCQQEAKRISISDERQKLLDLKKENTTLTLNQIRRLFRKKQTAVNWELNSFRSLLKRLTDGDKSSQQKKHNVRAYFRKLTGFLSTEKYSRCAWEIVKAEILTLLKHVQKTILNTGDEESAK